MTKLNADVVDNVFQATDGMSTDPFIKTEYKDSDGNVVGNGSPVSAFSNADWVARVSSMSLSIKVTPKIGNDFLSVERAITVDINTLDKDIVHGIWKDLQQQVTSGVFNTLSLTLKQLNEVKKGI